MWGFIHRVTYSGRLENLSLGSAKVVEKDFEFYTLRVSY